MAPTTPPPRGQNSLLHMLNPYASMSRSTNNPRHDPDSPSTMLLRELSGEDHPEDEQDENEEDHDRARMSPTPTGDGDRRRTLRASRPTHVIATSSSTSTDDDDDEEDGNGPDVGSDIFGEEKPSMGDRTPKSPVTPQQPGSRTSRTATTGRLAKSPGPFREFRDHSQPRNIDEGSTSTSTSPDHSRSTSPGPSSISIYASGLDQTALESPSIPTTSRDPSTSPDGPGHHQPLRPLSANRKTPTFKEPPNIAKAGPSTSARPPVNSSSSMGKKASPRPSTGYLDPPISGIDRKGKGKAKQKGGRTYQALPTNQEGDDEDEENDRNSYANRKVAKLAKTGLNEYEKALWRWVNVDDLDGFLQEVYEYYKGKGIWCILLARFLNLVTTFFVIGFSTFLLSCIDYSKLDHELAGPDGIGRLDDVLIGQCVTRGSFPHMVFIFSVGAVYVFQLASFAMSIPRLVDMWKFYTHLLGVPDADIQTLPWPEIVRLIGEIRKHNPVTSLSNGQAGALAEMVGEDITKGQVKKLDAHDVANRILRQENYLIALFNKDLLDLTVRLPLPQSIDHLIPTTLLATPPQEALPTTSISLDKKYLSLGENGLTKALEWNLRFCLMGYLFDRRGQVRKEFVKERRRKDLVEGLKRRFIFMGVLNAIFAPFIVVYLLIYSFFRYFEEYHKNPSSIGSRQYTLYAQWKFREFNELPHLFERRLDRSYPIAKEYIDQFPKEKTAVLMRFVAFVAGAFAAVLLVASLIDPDLFLHFEISPHRTVLFYLGIFGSVLAIARGMVPEENLVFDPEASLIEVVRWTHYLPGEWRGKLHSQMVHAEFSKLFAMKISVFFTELLSVLLTPFILLFSLPPCAAAIIDFFREFTVHVDGVGYVCSFAVFDFRRHGNLGPSTSTPHENDPSSPTIPTSNGNGGDIPAPAPRGRLGALKSPTNRVSFSNGNGNNNHRANENKMEKSFLHFKATHPDWQPDPSSSIFLDKLVGLHRDTIPSIGNTLGGGNMSGPIYAGGRGLGLGGGGMGSRATGFVGSNAREYGYNHHLGGLALADESRLRERSRSYDRAWAKSSHLLRPSVHHLPPNNPTNTTNSGHEGASTDISGAIRLATMQEGPEGPEGGTDLDTEEVERLGWNAKIKAGDMGNGSGDEDDDDHEGFLRDAGMVGLLQQIMNR